MFQLSIPVLAVLCFLGLAHLTLAQEPYEFINPPARIGAIDTDETRNAVYTVGNSMNITWRSNASTISLTIRQSRANDPETDIGDMQYLPDSKAILRNWYEWEIGTNGQNGQPFLDLAQGNVFRFNVFAFPETVTFSISTFFNLTNDTVDAHGSIISRPPLSTSSSTTFLIASSSSPPTSSAVFGIEQSSSATPVPDSGLSSGAKVGLGAGLGVGIPILLGVLVGAFFLWKRSKKEVAPREQDTATQWPMLDKNGQHVEMPPYSPQPRYELSTQNQDPHELPGHGYR